MAQRHQITAETATIDPRRGFAPCDDEHAEAERERAVADAWHRANWDLVTLSRSELDRGEAA